MSNAIASTGGTPAVKPERRASIPLRLLQNLQLATQNQARVQRIVDPKPSTQDVAHANEWVMESVEAIKNCVLEQGILC